MNVSRETIAAIATPIGPGGVGVIRVSGQRSLRVLKRLFRSNNGSRIASHKMLMGWIIDPETKKKIDQILACYMKTPKSFTGEDVVELYCHGGPAILKNVLKLTLNSGARLAERGEFTKRAFLNNKMDLSQAEAVLDLVSSASSTGTGLAIQQLEGRLSKIIFELRQRLISVLAGLEAEIDFPEDMPMLGRKKMAKKLAQLNRQIDQLLASADNGRMYRQGLAVTIIGRPNVGKSSILNALLEEQRAIVTRAPGTTRDTIIETLEIDGLPVRIIDTAGLRRPRNRAEDQGIKRAEQEALAADLILAVIDGSVRLTSQDKEVINKLRDKQGILVLNKSDLGQKVSMRSLRKLHRRIAIVQTSAINGSGIAKLRSKIAKIGLSGEIMAVKDPIYINARHQECLKRAKYGLFKAIESSSKGMQADFITIDLKSAILALGEITGELVSEEVINTIFSKFCVGK